MKTTRRFRAALLAFALVFTLAACGTPAVGPTPTPAPTQSEASAPDAARDTPDTSAPSETERQEEAPPVGEQQPMESGAPEENASDALPTGDSSDAQDSSSNKPDAPPESAVPTCTVSISCAAILENLDRLDAEKTDLVPADGVLLAPTAVEFTEGESVFDVLKRVCRENKIHMEFSETPVYQSAYIEGIGNLYEFDCGEGSGWMYRVNGEFPNYGCSRYVLADGDTVEWVYTCDFGADVGGRVGA